MTRTLLALVALVVLAAAVPGQNLTPTPPPPLPPATPLPGSAVAPARPLDQIFDELEQVRARKAEIEKLEAALVQEAQQRLEKHGERARQLGVTPAAPRAPLQPDPLVAPARPR